MDRKQVSEKLKQDADALVERFKVNHLYLFGSAARNQANELSDLDFLVDFQGPATVEMLLDLADYLEELFSTKVDLITRPALKPNLSARIFSEMIRVA
jgi:predicted nucleotidyltransferase